MSDQETFVSFPSSQALPTLLFPPNLLTHLFLKSLNVFLKGFGIICKMGMWVKLTKMVLPLEIQSFSIFISSNRWFLKFPREKWNLRTFWFVTGGTIWSHFKTLSATLTDSRIGGSSTRQNWVTLSPLLFIPLPDFWSSCHCLMVSLSQFPALVRRKKKVTLSPTVLVKKSLRYCPTLWISVVSVILEKIMGRSKMVEEWVEVTLTSSQDKSRITTKLWINHPGQLNTSERKDW